MILVALVVITILSSSSLKVVHGNDDGLALLPPMGWRSWNLYGGSIDQMKMMSILTGMVQQRPVYNPTNPTTTTKMMSLCDLGYCNVGLDDLWQDCNSIHAKDGMHYHDKLGNPLVNMKRFPSLLNMTSYGHLLNLTVGWYANNCACSDHCRTDDECNLQIQQDVKALFDYGFDSIKIDGCGNETNLIVWNQYIQQYSRSSSRHSQSHQSPHKGGKILIENCHGSNSKYKPNRTLPPEIGCPYHYYRTSQDIRNQYGSIISNLRTMKEYRTRSYPGCWAYPDMLMVGVGSKKKKKLVKEEGGGGRKNGTTTTTSTTTEYWYGLNLQETRSHFASWAIVSSPLILSHDVNDNEVTNRIWDIISNRDILAVNQVYDYVHDDPGGVYYESTETIDIPDRNANAHRVYTIPLYQYHSKPLGGTKNQTAILLLNSDNKTRTLTAQFSDIPSLQDDDYYKTTTNCCYQKYSTTTTTTTRLTSSTTTATTADAIDHCSCRYEVYDLWSHSSLGVHRGSWSVEVEPHDAAFIVVHRVDDDDDDDSSSGPGIIPVVEVGKRGGGGGGGGEKKR